MAALTFSPDRPSPQQMSAEITDLSLASQVVGDVFPLPPATFCGRPSSFVWMIRLHSAPGSIPKRHWTARGTGRPSWSAQPGRPGKHRPSTENISPLCQLGNIWPSETLAGPPDRLAQCHSDAVTVWSPQSCKHRSQIKPNN